MLALLLLAAPVFADKWGLEDKDAKFFERVREVAAEGATVKRARAFREQYAKQPDPDLLRGLGWLVGDEKSSLDARRGAHILLLVLSGADVKTPDPDIWFAHIERLAKNYVKPRPPSAGEVRAAIQLGAAWLYAELDTHGILRQQRWHPREKRKIDVPSIYDTAIAVVALHRCGVPRNDPLLKLTLITCAAMIDTPRYREQRAVVYVGPEQSRVNDALYRDYAMLVWALAEFEGELPNDAAKRILRWPQRHTTMHWDRHRGLLALRALQRRGEKFPLRSIARIEKEMRRTLTQAKAEYDYIHWGLDGAILTSAIKLQRPKTTPEQLRSDAAIARHVPYVFKHGAVIASGHAWHLLTAATVRDDLQLRTLAASKGRGNPYEKGVLHLIERQTPAGDWKPFANDPPAHLTGPALIFLAGETEYTATRAPKAQKPK